jgi:hypothetical protein
LRLSSALTECGAEEELALGCNPSTPPDSPLWRSRQRYRVMGGLSPGPGASGDEINTGSSNETEEDLTVSMSSSPENSEQLPEQLPGSIPPVISKKRKRSTNDQTSQSEEGTSMPDGLYRTICYNGFRDKVEW